MITGIVSRFAILLAAGVCALCWVPTVERLGAQERGPIGIPMFRVAPKAVAAEVDGAAMSIVYGPPSMQGRTIFGGEVPYESAWCGARQQRYNARLNVGSTALRRETLSSAVEQLTFTIQSNQPRPGGSVAFEWETTRASAAFTVGR